MLKSLNIYSVTLNCGKKACSKALKGERFIKTDRWSGKHLNPANYDSKIDITLKSIFHINKLIHAPCACVTDHLLEETWIIASVNSWTICGTTW